MNKTAVSLFIGAALILPLFASATTKPKDTKAPVIASHADVTVVVNGVTSSVATYTKPTATDNIDTSVTVTCTPVSGSTFNLGATVVTCKAQDAAGNKDESTFKVIVKDNTPPSINISHIASSGTNPAQAATGDTVTLSFTTSENIFPPIILVNSHQLLMHSVGSETNWQGSYVVQSRDALGKVDYLVTAIDKAGNIKACSNIHLPIIGYCPPSDNSSVSVVKPTPPDTTPPVIAAHANITTEATGATGAVVTYSPPTASDNSGATVSVDCAPASGSTFPLGNTTVTCVAQDAAGNAATPTTFTVTVKDTTSPVIGVVSPVSSEATGPTGTTVNFIEPNAVDIVDTTDTVTCTPASGSMFALGNSTVTCNATDVAGNHAAPVSFTMTVVDTTAPTIDTHPNISVVSTETAGAVVSYAPPAATDSVDGVESVLCSPLSGSTFAYGTTTVTCSTTDAHGNSAQSTFAIGVAHDTTVVTPPAPFTMAGQQDESYLCLPDESDGWRACYTGGNSLYTILLGSGAGLQGGTIKSVTVALDPTFATGNPSIVTNPWTITIKCYTDAAYTTVCPDWVGANVHNANQNYFVFGQATQTTDNKHWTVDLSTADEENFDGSSPVTFRPAYFYQMTIDDNGIGWPAYGQNPTGNPTAQPYWVLTGMTN